MAGLNCVVVTPEATEIDQKVDSVVVPLFDGEMGIASNHAPMIGRLGYGELRLRTGGTTRSYFVGEGFVQVQDNLISVLTGHFKPADEVDGDDATKMLEEALAESAHTPETMVIRDKKFSQARGMLRVARRKA